jgi:Putative transposase
LQAALCTYRIALGPRAGQKALSLQTVSRRGEPATPTLCANAHGFSLHAAVGCGAGQRKELECLCRYITRPTIANERLKRNRASQGHAATEECLPQRHHPRHHVAAGIYATVGRCGAAPAPASDTLSRGAGTDISFRRATNERQL